MTKFLYFKPFKYQKSNLTKKNLSDVYKGIIKSYMSACGIDVSDNDIKKAVSIQEMAGSETNYIVDYYKRFEVIDNIVQDSELTITENMADFAGMQCVMDIVGDDKDAQREALESYARVWARLGTEKYVTNSNLLSDVHSSNNVRVDAIVASLDQFYELYNIQEGDSMYIAPEDRLKLW